MNFFEKEMRMMFEHTGIIQDPKFVGRTMVGILIFKSPLLESRGECSCTVRKQATENKR